MSRNQKKYRKIDIMKYRLMGTKFQICAWVFYKTSDLMDWGIANEGYATIDQLNALVDDRDKLKEYGDLCKQLVYYSKNEAWLMEASNIMS